MRRKKETKGDAAITEGGGVTALGNKDKAVGKAKGTGRQRRRRGGGKLGIALPLLLLLVGMGFLAWPAATEQYTVWKAEQAISEITDVYDAMTAQNRIDALDQAHAYNDHLMGIETEVKGGLNDYDEQLTFHDQPSTMMAWIEIPKIGTKLAVYHHTTEGVLMTGVGHIDTTSLPVGGEGTLCALSGHSGMQNKRMFDDIRKLEPGDKFVIWTLGDPYAYCVTDTKVVEPYDTSGLEPQPGRDLCVLITCTPLNVNTHRLIVTAERCEYVPDDEALKAGTDAVVNGRNLPLLVGGGVCAAVLLALAIAGIVRRRRKRKAKAAAETTAAVAADEDTDTDTTAADADESEAMPPSGEPTDAQDELAEAAEEPGETGSVEAADSGDVTDEAGD